MNRKQRLETDEQPTAFMSRRVGLNRRSILLAGTATAAAIMLPPVALAQSTPLVDEARPRFRRIRTQFIAALGEPDATTGNNAQLWGLWRQDPGPRGVRLNHYERLVAAHGIAPARWKFDSADWWLEENGLIMEQPEFPLAPGRYLVTGAREVTTMLTVYPQEADGTQRWGLADGATIYDVTHLRCRSARYTSETSNNSCSPSKAQQSAFPVTPGSTMPPVEGCNKQDYAVLFVIGVAVEA